MRRRDRASPAWSFNCGTRFRMMTRRIRLAFALALDYPNKGETDWSSRSAVLPDLLAVASDPGDEGYVTPLELMLSCLGSYSGVIHNGRRR